jgi:hypothetical protein
MAIRHKICDLPILCADTDFLRIKAAERRGFRSE